MRHRAHPDQAGFFRRFFAFALDDIIVSVLFVLIFLAGSEAVARIGGRAGELSRLAQALHEGASVSIAPRGTSSVMTIGDSKVTEAGFKDAFLEKLRPAVSDEEFLEAKGLGLAELERKYPRVMDEFPAGRAKLYAFGGSNLSILYQFFCGYLYFIFFFRISGRTPGKRIFGLKVISLDGRPRLGWYQAFERTHGYAASAIAASIGFLQVLWDREGLTMHDKIAGTTVVRWRNPKLQPAATKRAKGKPEEPGKTEVSAESRTGEKTTTKAA